MPNMFVNQYLPQNESSSIDIPTATAEIPLSMPDENGPVLPYSDIFDPQAWDELFESASDESQIQWEVFDDGEETEETNTKDVAKNTAPVENLPSIFDAKMRFSSDETDDEKHDDTLRRSHTISPQTVTSEHAVDDAALSGNTNTNNPDNEEKRPSEKESSASCGADDAAHRLRPHIIPGDLPSSDR